MVLAPTLERSEEVKARQRKGPGALSEGVESKEDLVLVLLRAWFVDQIKLVTPKDSIEMLNYRN